MFSASRCLNRAGTGSGSVTVHGVGLSMSWYTSTAQIILTRCEATEWESETSVRCLASRGSRGTKRVVLTAGESGGSVSESWSWDLGGLSVSRRGNRAGTGSVSVTLHGASLGLQMYTVHVRGGFTRCESSEWESATSVRCLVSQGDRTTRRVVITTGLLSGSSSALVSMDKSVLQSVFNQNGASTGSTSITLYGLGFGIVSRSSTLRISSSLSEATDWWSQTALRCRFSLGTRSSQKHVLSAAVSVSTASNVFSFERASGSVLRPNNVKSTGSSFITVAGSALGLLSRSQAFRLGDSAAEVTNWISTSSARSISSAGIASTRRLQISVGSRTGSLSEALSLDVASVSIHKATSPGATRIHSVSISGSAFDVHDKTVQSRPGFTGATATIWKSETSVVCKTSAMYTRSHDHLVVTVGERQSTATNFYIYQPPVISSVLNVNSAMHSTSSITVFGWNYGQYESSIAMRLGGSACVNTRWISDSSMSCKPANGYFVPKSYLPIIMTVSGAVQRQLCERNNLPPAACDSWKCAESSMQSSAVIMTSLCQVLIVCLFAIVLVSECQSSSA